MNPYQPSQLGAAPFQQGGHTGPSAAFDSARGISGATTPFLGIMAVWGILMTVVYTILARVSHGASITTISQIIGGLESLVQLVTLILYLVWLARFTGAIRQTQGTSRYTPGMAVGGWFIPFFNMVAPYLSLRDVWDRTPDRGQRASGGGIVAIWWASYWILSLTRVFYALLPMLRLDLTTEMMPLFTALGWFTTLVRLVCYGSWIFIVRSLSERSRQL